MKCMVQDCDQEARVRNMCDKHYTRYKRHGDPTFVKKREKCTVEGCNLEAYSKNMCEKHYRRHKKHGDPTIIKHKYPPRGKCIVEGCELEANGARNMCRKHYIRWQRHSDPTVIKHAPHGELLRFLHEVVLLYKDKDCFPWPYGCDSDGYGQIHINSKGRRVHVVVCEIVNGPRPSENHVASHKCGNGHLGCVNPQHLKWQTRTEDCADRAQHGRWLLIEHIGKRED